MRLTLVKMIFVAMALLMIGSAVSAENYVSWGGGFHIEIPDDWEQIDYQTVDVFLISNQAGKSVLDYDAVFAPSASVPFFAGNYLIITIDTVGRLSQTQIDSVLAEMGATFGRNVKYYPVGDFLADMKSSAPSYDAEKKLVTVINDIVQRDQITKKLMLMTKFYEKGLATFYYYSPESLFEQSNHVVSEIVQSFSTEDLEAAAGKADLRVADVDVDKKDKDDDDSSISMTIWIPLAGMVVILIAIMAGKKKKARQKQQDSNSK